MGEVFSGMGYFETKLQFHIPVPLISLLWRPESRDVWFKRIGDRKEGKKKGEA